MPQFLSQLRISLKFGFCLLGFCFPLSLYAGDVSLEFNSTLGQKYDDNINYAKNNKQSDFISSVGLGANIQYENKKLSGSLSASVLQEFFFEHTQHRNTSENLAIKLTQELNKSDYLTLSNALNYSQEPLDFEEEFTRVGRRISYLRNKFDLTLSRQLSKQFLVHLRYGHDLNQTSQQGFLDSYVNLASLKLDYLFSSKTKMFGQYEFLNRKLEPLKTDANVHTLIGALQQNITEKFSLEGQVGLDLIDSYNGRFLRKPVWSIVAYQRMNEKTLSHVSVSERYSTNPYTDDIFKSWRISAGVERDFSFKLSGALSTFWGQGEYVASNIKDDLIGVSTAMTYELSKNVKGNFSYTHSRALSSSNDREYRKNVVFLGVKADF